MSWEEMNLGDLATFVNGYPFKPSDWSNDGIEIIRIQNLTKSSSETNYFKGTIPEKYKVNSGDILISWSATLDIYVWDGGEAWLNQHIFKVVFDKAEVNQRFFIYLIKNILEDMRKQVHGATMKHITKEKFDNLKVAIPPLSAQKRIADILDAADALKRKDQELLKKYDELAQSIFIDMFGDPVKNEKGWEVKKLSEVVDPNKIITYGIVQAGENVEGGIPYIRTGDIKNGKIAIQKLLKTSPEIAMAYKRSEVRKGDIIMSIRATVGTVALLPDELDGANLTQGTARISPNKEINTLYLYEYLRSEAAQNWINRYAKGATFREITLTRLRELPILVPPFNIQNQFAEKVKLLEDQLDLLKQNVSLSESLFQSLIQKSFKVELTN